MADKKKEKEIKEKEVKEELKEKEEVNKPTLEDKVIELEAENAKLKNEFLRAYADTENLKKRLNAEADSVRKYRIQSFAQEILPVLDNLERALASEIPKGSENFYKGVEMIYSQLVNALKNEGVSEIDCLDKPFDPNFHQAMITEKKEGVEPGVVIEVLQKGYVLKDRILRASMVKVSE